MLSPARMRYLYRGILSSRSPVRKQPSMEPRELIMRRKLIWPSVTPTYSTVQYTVQYSTVKYKTVQYRDRLCNIVTLQDMVDTDIPDKFSIITYVSQVSQ